MTQSEKIKRGELLVITYGCNDCHSPKVFGPGGPIPDPNKILSGHPSDLPLADYDKKTTENYVLFNMHNTASICFLTQGFKAFFQ